MKPVMYIFANTELGMSPGKLAAQCSHAAVEAYRLSQGQFSPLLDEWLERGYTKLIMEARDTQHLLSIERYLKDKGFNSVLIIDEGRTEIAPHTPTALGVQVVDKESELTQFAFSDFKTLKPPKEADPYEAFEGTFFLKHLARWLTPSQ